MTQECPNHEFELYERRPQGFWQKRECPGDGYLIPGSIEICRACGMMRLKPDDAKLNIVECHGPIDDVGTEKKL